MHRGKRMKALCGLFIALAILPGHPAHADSVLTLGHAVTPDHPRALAARHFAKSVKTRSGGRITVEILGGASFGDDVAMLKALQNGSLDISANSQGPVSALVPEINAFGMPFLFSRPEQAWRILDGPLGQQLSARLSGAGLVALGFWDNGIRHFSNASHPLLKPADFSGLIIRTPADPVATAIVEALGATAVQIRFSGLYKALKRRVVDGQENPLVNIRGARLHEVQKYITLTGHRYETTPFIMSLRSWSALPPGDQGIVRVAADEATRYQRELNQQAEEDAYRALTAAGMRIDKVDTAPFIAATRSIYATWYASDSGPYVRAVVREARGYE